MKRFLFVLLITVLGCFASFQDALYGVLLYTWFSFASPVQLSYGMLEGLELSKIIAGVAILTTIIQYRKLASINSQLILCALYFFVCVMSLTFSMDFSLNYILSHVQLIASLLIMALLTPVVLTTPRRLGLFVLIIGLSSGALGAYYGFFGLFAGSRNIVGPGKIGDNNGYAVMLVSTLPFIQYSASLFKDSKLKILTIFVVLLNMLAIVLTFSRAGLLSMSIVLCLMLLQSRAKAFFIVVLGLLIPAFIVMIIYSGVQSAGDVIVYEQPEDAKGKAASVIDSYIARIKTLTQPTEEIDSVQSRFHFWKVALEISKEYPFLGVGFGNYRMFYDQFDVSKGEYGSGRSVHSTPLIVLAETGWVGLLVFILIFFFAVFEMIQARVRLASSSGFDTDLMYGYIRMTITSMVGFFIGSLFVVCLYQEMLWCYVSMSIAISRISYSLASESLSIPSSEIKKI